MRTRWRVSPPASDMPGNRAAARQRRLADRAGVIHTHPRQSRPIAPWGAWDLWCSGAFSRRPRAAPNNAAELHRAPRFSGPVDELAPPRLRLRADSGTRLLAGGSVLVGGSPVRVLRLTAAGAGQVAAWLGGAPVGDSAPARRLARRLLDAGVAHPDWGGCDVSGSFPGMEDVTVVIPVRDRHAELARCLAGLCDAAGDLG